MRILIPITLLLIISCSTEKKNQQAVKRVEANVDLLNQVGEVYRKLAPCANDTVTAWVHDSTTVTNTIVKTKTDTFTKDGTKYIFRLDTAFFEKTRYQTQTKIVVDREKENRLTDSLNSQKVQLSYYKGRNAELNEDKAALKKSNTKLWWLVIAVVVAGVLSHVFRSKIFPIKLS